MTHDEPTKVAVALSDVRARVAAAAARANRDASTVRLVAVTKTIAVERLREALVAGAHDFGENYVQEWRGKADTLAEESATGAIAWHFVGRLQRNKVKYVVGRVALVHAIDSLELAEELANRAAARGVVQTGLVEVNVAGETTKAGFEVTEAVRALRKMQSLAGLRVAGFMTMPPPTENPDDSRGSFRALRELRDRAQNEVGVAFPELSMGMSGDFEVAIEEGATLVRVGTAIFGARVPREV